MHDNRPATNRLAGESSPYLLQHAGNPVDWFPWGEEALERARREDRPIFLSVGYSTCYWCHVMERESFTDPQIAAFMNREFVNIKVDREERPDLDEIYMLATQLLTGQGGWPNSLFLTPQLRPYFAGTYFPPEERWGRPGFRQVLASMSHAWRERRADVEEQAAELARAIEGHLAGAAPTVGGAPDRISAESAERSLAALRQRFDATHGGFGTAPKFPTPANLWLLAELADERPEAGMMLDATLAAMGRGGIFDQLAGGFHRYATDAGWKVPHFEKMLYDNGLLLEVYADRYARTGEPDLARVVAATAGFLERELRAPGGAFWSAIDAEVAGHEGGHHVWTRAELDAVLGREDADFLAPLLGFGGEPFFEEQWYVLHLPLPLAGAARLRHMTRDELLALVDPLLARLAAARAERPRPATDDKVLADWNGTAIAGLAAAGAALGSAHLLDLARGAATAVLRDLRTADGTLLHAWRGGSGRVRAFLADYAFLVRGLLRLHATTDEPRWLDAAIELATEQQRRLAAPGGGWYNAEPAPDLLARGQEVFDGALPAANPVAMLNALALHAATGDPAWRSIAERAVRGFVPIAQAHPEAARTLTLALRRLAGGRASASAGPEAAEAQPAASEADGASGAGIARLVGRIDAPAPDGTRAVEVQIEVADGWHLAAEPQPPTLHSGGAEISIELPDPELFADQPPGVVVRGWTGSVTAHGRLPAGAPTELELIFSACGAGACHPPARRAVSLQ